LAVAVAAVMADPVPLPDHLESMRSTMRTRRRGRSRSRSQSTTGAGRRLSSGLRIKKKKDKSVKVKAADSKADESGVSPLPPVATGQAKEKFNIIEEFFICLACIFD
jgi:hypothetical protein